MAVPKRKTTPSKRNMRRSHHALGKISVVENAKTGEYQLPHHISLDGIYNGREVFSAPTTDKDDETTPETL